MHYIDTTDHEIKGLGFYLAEEEYVARHILKDEDCFFIWHVHPTVIFGRNQVVENEVNMDYCRQEGIRVIQRHSGGGCVYADENCLMISYITKETRPLKAFDTYLNLFTGALNRLGITAKRNDHNDIMLGQYKISGNAMWNHGDSTIAHGTLLYDTNEQHITHAITPTQQKLEKNGVKSVRQRIALLKEHTTLTRDELWKGLRKTLCSSTIILGDDDMQKIAEQEKREYPNLAEL